MLLLWCLNIQKVWTCRGQFCVHTQTHAHALFFNALKVVLQLLRMNVHVMLVAKCNCTCKKRLVCPRSFLWNHFNCRVEKNGDICYTSLLDFFLLLQDNICANQKRHCMRKHYIRRYHSKQIKCYMTSGKVEVYKRGLNILFFKYIRVTQWTTFYTGVYKSWKACSRFSRVWT